MRIICGTPCKGGSSLDIDRKTPICQNRVRNQGDKCYRHEQVINISIKNGRMESTAKLVGKMVHTLTGNDYEGIVTKTNLGINLDPSTKDSQ